MAPLFPNWRGLGGGQPFEIKKGSHPTQEITAFYSLMLGMSAPYDIIASKSHSQAIKIRIMKLLGGCRFVFTGVKPMFFIIYFVVPFWRARIPISKYQ